MQNFRTKQRHFEKFCQFLSAIFFLCFNPNVRQRWLFSGNLPAMFLSYNFKPFSVSWTNIVYDVLKLSTELLQLFSHNMASFFNIRRQPLIGYYLGALLFYESKRSNGH